MHKLLVIARREWAAMVVTKAFLFTLIMMPVLMLGSIVAMPLLGKIGGNKERRIVVVDGTGVVFETIASAAKQRNEMMTGKKPTGRAKGGKPKNPFEAGEIWNFELAAEVSVSDEQQLALSDQLREGSLYAFVEIPEDFFQSPQPTATFVSQDAALSGARQWLTGILANHARTRKLNELGIDPALAMKADIPVAVEPTRPYAKSAHGKAETEDGQYILATMFLPFGVMMLMFMVIFLAAQPMLESAMEEKSDRIAELLLGSVSPTQLMAGKLIGNVAGSLVVFAIYGLGAAFVAHHNEWSLQLPWSSIPWLLIFQLLGVLFFSSIFLTIGASVRELKEAQSLLLPVWLLLAAPLMVWFVAIRDPNGVVAVTLSFFPPSAPLMMSLRLAVGQAMPVWHAPLAALLMLAATCVVVLLAGRIYRASLLKSDSAKSFVALLRRLRAAE